jgi:plastocyanin
MHATMRPVLVVLVAAAMTLLLAGVVAAAGAALVSQKGRAFSLGTLQIMHGDVVKFTNDDKFLHQIYVDTPAFDYDSAEQEPGSSVEIRFPESGTFEVRCHIHPKMLLSVDVR